MTAVLNSIQRGFNDELNNNNKKVYEKEKIK